MNRLSIKRRKSILSAAFCAIVISLILVLVFQGSIRAGTTARGETLFNSNCTACHVLKSNNSGLVPVANSKSLSSMQAFKQLMQNGRGAMPAQIRIAGKAEDLKDLYLYLKSIK